MPDSALLYKEIRTHPGNPGLVEEFHARKLTQKQIAEALGVHKSFISKKLSGEGNMTLETLSDLAYALDRPVLISLPSRHPATGSNMSPEQIDAVGPVSSKGPISLNAPRGDTGASISLITAS